MVQGLEASSLRLAGTNKPFEYSFPEKQFSLPILPVHEIEKYIDHCQHGKYHKVDNDQHGQGIVALTKSYSLFICSLGIGHNSHYHAANLS